MRRIISIFTVMLLLISLASCGDGGDASSQGGSAYPSRTAEFYGTMDMNSFWFTMEFTNNGATYGFTQATNGNVVTTIEDYDNDSLDTYEIYDGKCVHKLNISGSSYNTAIGLEGQTFLFAGYDASMFVNPSTNGVKTFEDVSYHCESFVTKSMSGSGSGVNNYYFDGDRLKAVEIIDGGETVMVMRIKDYSNTVPSDIYLSAPSGFKAGELEYYAPDISDGDIPDEWGLD